MDYAMLFSLVGTLIGFITVPISFTAAILYAIYWFRKNRAYTISLEEHLAVIDWQLNDLRKRHGLKPVVFNNIDTALITIEESAEKIRVHSINTSNNKLKLEIRKAFDKLAKDRETVELAKLEKKYQKQALKERRHAWKANKKRLKQLKKEIKDAERNVKRRARVLKRYEKKKHKLEAQL